MTKQSNRLCTKSENGGSAHPRGITDALIDCHQAQQKQLVQMSNNVSINETGCKVLKQDGVNQRKARYYQGLPSGYNGAGSSE